MTTPLKPKPVPMPRALLAIAHWPLRELYRTILEREGYGVGEAGSNESSLDQVTQDPPDLVVVCADDPRVQTTTTLGKFVADLRLQNPGTAVLALTTNDLRRSQMAKAGLTDCLTLPASIERITATLEEIARRKFGYDTAAQPIEPETSNDDADETR